MRSVILLITWVGRMMLKNTGREMLDIRHVTVFTCSFARQWVYLACSWLIKTRLFDMHIQLFANERIAGDSKPE